MRTAWVLSMSCACLLGMRVAVTAGDPPAAAPQAGTARIVGRVPVLPRKSASAVKDYGPPPAFKVEPPDPASSAVWVGSGAPVLDAGKVAAARIEQRGYQFRPALSVVQAGTPVVFPNEDQLYHSVFSYSPAKRFDLGRFRKGEEPNAVVLDTPGVVQLFCEVHEHMRANLLVVDTPWHAVTDAEGRFAIEGIAPGTHVVRVWLSPKQTVERTVTLQAGQSLEVDWSDLVTATGKDVAKDVAK
jgi:plastocyanin